MQDQNRVKKSLLIVEEDSIEEEHYSYNYQESYDNQSTPILKSIQLNHEEYPSDLQIPQVFDDYLKTFNEFNENSNNFNSNELSMNQEERSYNSKREKNRKNQNFNSKHRQKIDQNKDDLHNIMQFKRMTVTDFINQKEKEKQITIEINGVKVYFPFEPYELQKTYMKKVIEALQTGQNALLESPTGTGKSLCLLSATLSWIYSQKLQGRHRKVIYLSRTHSQLAQIQKQLKKTCFRPTMSHVGSRDHFCIKPQFKTLKGREKMQACSKGVKLRLKDLQGKIKWKEMSESESIETYNSMCTYYRQKNDTVAIGTTYFSNQIYEMQDFLAEGEKHKFCPYYYPFHMDQYCDLFIMPYNYILDIDLLERFSKMIANSILIFDEAHNVADASCEGRSYQLFSLNVKGAEAELQKILLSSNISPSLKQVKMENKFTLQILYCFFEDLRSTITEFTNTIPFLKAPKFPEKLYVGEDMNQRVKVFDSQSIELALYEMLFGVMIDQSERCVFKKKGNHYITCIKKLISRIKEICSQIDEIIELLKETEDGIFHNMEKVANFWKKAAELLHESITFNQNFIEKEINHYRLILKINLEEERESLKGQLLIKDFSLELRCLVPWLTFKNIIEMQPRSMIFTSGTLSPLESWESELNIEAPIKLVNSHVITESQVRLNILKQNVKGNTFDFRFKNVSQNSNLVYQELTETIFEISRTIPNGMLVVCPNFKTLREIRYNVNMRENRERMNRVKKQIFEERGGEGYIEEFKEQSEHGAILYCVCRGRASEGIDFPDHHCRAVVFVGIPFPNIQDPLIIERKEHFQKLQKFRRSGDENTPGINWEKWYFNGTIRAINQSLGRLIRHSKDYGMLFLLDERYTESRFKKAMPQWTQMSISIWPEFTNKKIEGIEQFYLKNQDDYHSIINTVEKKRVSQSKVTTKEEIKKPKSKPAIPLPKPTSQQIVNKNLKITYFFKKAQKPSMSLTAWQNE